MTDGEMRAVLGDITTVLERVAQRSGALFEEREKDLEFFAAIREALSNPSAGHDYSKCSVPGCEKDAARWLFCFDHEPGKCSVVPGPEREHDWDQIADDLSDHTRKLIAEADDGPGREHHALCPARDGGECDCHPEENCVDDECPLHPTIRLSASVVCARGDHHQCLDGGQCPCSCHDVGVESLNPKCVSCGGFIKDHEHGALMLCLASVSRPSAGSTALVDTAIGTALVLLRHALEDMESVIHGRHITSAAQNVRRAIETLTLATPSQGTSS